MEDAKDELKSYEISYLARSEEDREVILSALKSHGANIVDEIKPTRIRLAYPIKKETSACFGCVCFDAAPEEAPKLSAELKLNQAILRFLIVTPPVKMIRTGISRFGKAPSPKLPETTPEMETAPTERREMSHREEILSNEELEKKLEEILK